MIRHAAAIVLALCVSTTPLHAQTTKLTVSGSATVHKSPSQASPVIGKAAAGTALVVTREVGDWVKVSWPDAQDGIGYVRVSAGTIARGGSAAPAVNRTVAASAQPAPVAASSASVAARVEQAPVAAPSAPSAARNLYVAPTHILGVGARAGGSTMGFGASTRAWSRRRLGAQFEVSRYGMNSPVMLGRSTTTDIAPSLLYSMRDHVSDYLWVRPYVGLGAHISHSTLTGSTPGFAFTSNTVGARVFGGGEFAFSSMPHFAVSADLGYYHLPTPFAGFEPGGIGLAISGHWYVK
jgi:hypothetical protein